MKCFVGVDLGSTTTKAVILDEGGEILGRGITNSRSDYALASQVAKAEAFHNARLELLKQHLAARMDEQALSAAFTALLRTYRHEQHLRSLEILEAFCNEEAVSPRFVDADFDVTSALKRIFTEIREESERELGTAGKAKSDFFRDLAGAAYVKFADAFSQEVKGAFGTLVGIFDKSIIRVENHDSGAEFEQILSLALERLSQGDHPMEALRGAAEELESFAFDEVATVGTGYGRQRLPFPPDLIRSEILCHGYGAHAMFPNTRTVLDIGGQDTKAIQVDAHGIVTNFQMNDRCAAGCGRYLGYIADEMNLGLHELGPMAMCSTRKVRINSTCTVFAGAELRYRLFGGEKREDILGGLHRAIILRAMSLLARSGGVRNEFTFTGGVAKNTAAVAALRDLVDENFGSETVINIAPDSIYTGALGAALFALEDFGTPAVDSLEATA